MTVDRVVSLGMRDRIMYLLMLISVGSIFFLGLYFSIQALYTPIPFHYSAEVYQPVNGELCPGDTLVYAYQKEIERVPTIIVSFRSWEDAENSPIFGIRTVTSSRTYSQARTYVRTGFEVVPDLLPGNYYLVRAGQSLNSPVAVLRVPVTIREDCDV